jgi:hypothetical protein
MWSEPSRGQGWLQAVNGFYRATRGTYAQFGVLLPSPKSAIDTTLTHVRLNSGFASGGCVNACNVLDVVHNLWLCCRQTSYRHDEIVEFARMQIRLIAGRWVKGEGLGFSPKQRPSLKGTEMWLATLYVLADILEMSDFLGYKPRGVHLVRSSRGDAPRQ